MTAVGIFPLLHKAFMLGGDKITWLGSRGPSTQAAYVLL